MWFGRGRHFHLVQLRAQRVQVAARRHGFLVAADYFQASAEMRGQGISGPVCRRDGYAVTLGKKAREVMEQRGSGRLKLAHHFRDLGRKRHERAAQ